MIDDSNVVKSETECTGGAASAGAGASIAGSAPPEVQELRRRVAILEAANRVLSEANLFHSYNFKAQDKVLFRYAAEAAISREAIENEVHRLEASHTKWFLENSQDEDAQLWRRLASSLSLVTSQRDQE